MFPLLFVSLLQLPLLVVFLPVVGKGLPEDLLQTLDGLAVYFFAIEILFTELRDVNRRVLLLDYCLHFLEVFFTPLLAIEEIILPLLLRIDTCIQELLNQVVKFHRALTRVQSMLQLRHLVLSPLNTL